ncbi:MAG: FAD-dependent oxidoreductase [Bacteroidales bacterium]|nr:FAD-dependent oxidoreductase [Bacteroidales bacterium]
MNPILIIGGGISGVTAAVELAEAGKEVILAERTSHLGGNVVKMHNYFPKLCPPACGMEINFRRIRNNTRIRVLTHAEVLSIEGVTGEKRVRIKISGKRVNDLCTACGECVEVCPEERPDQFNYNFGVTRAIYMPYPLAFPQKYEIDTHYCKGTGCAKCAEICAYNAIDLEAEDKVMDIDVHSVIVATGWENYDPSKIDGLNYEKSKDIVSNVEFERLLSVTGPGKGKLLRPSDGKAPGSIAFVQCAGSRDRNYLSYCSAVCCSASLKHALNVTEISPETRVDIYYIDLRVTGRNEDFLRRVENIDRIGLVKGKVAAVDVAGNNELIVAFEDFKQHRKMKVGYDMVVLATGIISAGDIPGLFRNEEGFYKNQQQEGVYPVACAKKPMDVSSSVKDATSAALLAMKEDRIK